MNDSTYERPNAWMNALTNLWMNAWLNDWMNAWFNEWMNEWMNEWVNEWMHTWINEWLHDWLNARPNAMSWMCMCRCVHAWLAWHEMTQHEMKWSEMRWHVWNTPMSESMTSINAWVLARTEPHCNELHWTAWMAERLKPYTTAWMHSCMEETNAMKFNYIPERMHAYMNAWIIACMHACMNE